MPVPQLRIQRLSAAPVALDRDYVLYWMVANRRTEWNFALQRAVEWCRELNRPLVVLEALRLDYPWSGVRPHAFAAEGMADNARALDSAGVTRVSWLERSPGDGGGLLEALAARACVVVTDDFPCFFLPRMIHAAAARISTAMESVDSNGVLPLRASQRVFTTAASFRRHVQKSIWPHLHAFPEAMPLRDGVVRGASLPPEVSTRWPNTDLDDPRAAVLALPIARDPPMVVTLGGRRAGLAQLDGFLEQRLRRYHTHRNEPTNGAASGLSPYLHFGHVAAHEVLASIFEREGFEASGVAPKSNGSRTGWWPLSEPAEAFIDELVTWREIGFNRCHLDPEGYDRFETLPGWARQTLVEHAADPREWTYSLDEFARSRTHDPIWNAAQRELVRDGRMHNYLRMLWGKKILEWTPDPRTALEVLIELNNRYALDGRDPNSYSGIFWTLGRYDRAWGPERPIFGKVRFMSSESARRKLRLNGYLAEFGDEQAKVRELP